MPQDLQQVNAPLIGVPGGRHLLDTPALLIDLPAMARNIERMAAFAKARGINLRPHVKTHKSVEIARRQVAAGAIGVSCVTMGEAEVMVQGGIPGVLITSPAVTPSKIARLIKLAQRARPGDVMVVVDNPQNVAELARAASQLTHPLDVLVDYGAGYNRTGAATQAKVLELAALVAAEPRLRLRGLQSYAGNLQHIVARDERRAAAAGLRETVAGIVAAARRQGLNFDIVTGAGTGTHDLDTQENAFTELQAGSYVFMDAEYTNVLASGGQPSPFEVSLFVQTAVVSTNAADWVTVDGGTKCFSTDSGVPLVAKGADTASRYAFFGDEHGKLMPVQGSRPALGARVEFVTPHCDPTVNLHDAYHVVEGGTLVAIWPVDARGKR
ncbi:MULTISPECIES: DSD1 family PLP-dependent enzyme [unclassified Variovorax]|uniref:DSD1 family PLP-dependent enzyme n=1 Tax=unclassified Variovorax TaxID=663243 RepID=UPI0008CF370C|nr:MULTISPECIES: DSD1 family PLP-dependent enzyme [unclassified Variovorax]SEK07065.1 D-serine deaminase, pyridoxal phosphate-dependent [Variovorax sp. OK202]SFD48786.1 D-serine deaminase, pyridoxal phosphate-dependent [Variovorax sp. OK212]